MALDAVGEELDLLKVSNTPSSFEKPGRGWRKSVLTMICASSF
jgi:hypothetical protein